VGPYTSWSGLTPWVALHVIERSYSIDGAIHIVERLYSMDEALEIIERLDSYTSQRRLTSWVGLTGHREVLLY